MPHKALNALPAFKTEAEERTIWKTHDATDYLDLSKPQRFNFVNIKPNSYCDFEQYLCRVPNAPRHQGDEIT